MMSVHLSCIDPLMFGADFMTIPRNKKGVGYIFARDIRTPHGVRKAMEGY